MIIGSEHVTGNYFPMARLSIAEAALQVLKETDNPAVMWGDEGLLHLICERAGLKHRSWKTGKLILDGLARRPDLFEKKIVPCGRYLVRLFKPRKPDGT